MNDTHEVLVYLLPSEAHALIEAVDTVDYVDFANLRSAEAKLVKAMGSENVTDYWRKYFNRSRAE